eukprot:SAG31_NODE_3964_length_3711_cov_31.881229_2_plen_415_part_00
MCQLLEKYGTFIARCNVLIEKVSPCIETADLPRDELLRRRAELLRERKGLDLQKAVLEEKASQMCAANDARSERSAATVSLFHHARSGVVASSAPSTVLVTPSEHEQILDGTAPSVPWVHCFCFLPGPETIEISCGAAGSVKGAAVPSLDHLYDVTAEGSLVYHMFEEIGPVQNIQVHKQHHKDRPACFTAQVCFERLSADKMQELDKRNGYYAHRSAQRISVTNPTPCQVKLGGRKLVQKSRKKSSSKAMVQRTETVWSLPGLEAHISNMKKQLHRDNEKRERGGRDVMLPKARRALVNELKDAESQLWQLDVKHERWRSLAPVRSMGGTEYEGTLLRLKRDAKVMQMPPGAERFERLYVVMPIATVHHRGDMKEPLKRLLRQYGSIKSISPGRSDKEMFATMANWNDVGHRL